MEAQSETKFDGNEAATEGLKAPESSRWVLTPAGHHFVKGLRSALEQNARILPEHRPTHADVVEAAERYEALRQENLATYRRLGLPIPSEESALVAFRASFPALVQFE